jgi:VWFA-related protein
MVLSRILPLLLCSALIAQETDKTFRATVNVVVAPTIVTDRAGEYVLGLKPSNFRLYDNGKLQDIKVDEIFQPLSLVVVVQADSAMEKALPAIKKISTMLTTLLTGQQGEVAIVSFDHRITTLQDFTADPDKLKVALDKIHPGSHYSVMKDAVREGVRMLARRPRDQRKVLLLIGETRDKSSSGKTREVLADTQVANVTVYTINVNRLVSTLSTKTPVPRPDPIPPGGRHTPGPVANTPSATAQMGMPTGNVLPLFVEIFKDVRDIFVDNPAEAFTRYTGGREFSFVTQKDLENAIQALSTDLHSQYMISYNPDNKVEGGFHEIKVTVDHQDAPSWKVRTRPGYWMAGVPE